MESALISTNVRQIFDSIFCNWNCKNFIDQLIAWVSGYVVINKKNHDLQHLLQFGL